MRNWGIILGLCLLISSPSWADMQEDSLVSEVQIEDDDTTLNIVITGNNTEDAFADERLDMPDCNDSKLIADIVAKISAFQQGKASVMQIDKRKDALLLKNLHSFSEVLVKGFDSKKDYNVANRIIVTKINKGIADEQIRLCKSNGQGRAGEIYAMIYPAADSFVVDIINFIPEANAKEPFAIIYTK